MSKRKKQKRRKGKGKSAAGPQRFMKSDFPLYGCWINQDWQTISAAYITVARKLPSGLLVFASFIVDTARHQFRDCFGDSQVPEDKLRRKILEADSEFTLYKVDLGVVKEILAAAVHKLEEHGIRPEGVLQHCLKLVGDFDRELDELSQQQRAEEQFNYAVRLCYEAEDIEEAEAEVIQIPNVEKSGRSRPDHKEYYWFAEEKKSFPGRRQSRSPIARLSISEGELRLDICEEKEQERLHLLLLQYLGASVELSS